VCDFEGPTGRVHLVGVSISIEKNFYRLPFTPPPSGRLIGPSCFHLVLNTMFTTRLPNFSIAIKVYLSRVKTPCLSLNQ
jgi:hypothetical protein